jgi:hypothetical protein
MKKICIYILFCVFFLGLMNITQLFAADTMFKEGGYGYTLTYPNDWVYVKKSPHIIVFTKKVGTNANAPVVGIQNLFSKKIKDGKYSDMSAVVADFENQLRITKQAKVYAAEAFTYNKNGVKLTGKQFMAEYVFENKNFKQLVIVIPRKNEEIFHVWIYSAQAEQYDKYFPTVKAMLDSWVIAE